MTEVVVEQRMREGGEMSCDRLSSSNDGRGGTISSLVASSLVGLWDSISMVYSFASIDVGLRVSHRRDNCGDKIMPETCPQGPGAAGNEEQLEVSQSLEPNPTTFGSWMTVSKGAGNKKFKRNLRELVQIHKPEIIVLMETKEELTAMGVFFNCMGFTASTHVDHVDRNGGIWMLWNPTVVNVRVVEASSQQITTTISRQDY
ncbi:hypothetical protein LOK49_LG09G02854 [Camellia lanceoleosa]|uniref:Uncharacterized protein n=1 Tax=Camellia lanceoleosa TaxID=1840588 RepID=A0ACC0GN43_9ERIC|nr:hypothetical protein LOK49_LG09G02854 [Camellia lanceoleosa]